MPKITTLLRLRGSSGWVHENCYKAKFETQRRPQIDATSAETESSKTCGDCVLCGCPCVVRPRKVRKPIPTGKFRLLAGHEVKRAKLRFLKPGREGLVCYAGRHYWVDRDGNTAGQCNWCFSIDGRAMLPPSPTACAACGCINTTH